MIYVFYHNDPLAQDLGGGAEHFRCLHRALTTSELPFRLVGSPPARRPSGRRDRLHLARLGFLRFYLALGAGSGAAAKSSLPTTCFISTATTPPGRNCSWRHGGAG